MQVMAGETPEGALVRELEEELGIRVTRAACLLALRFCSRCNGLAAKSSSSGYQVQEDNCTPLTFASHAYDNFHLLMPLWKVRIGALILCMSLV